MIQDFKNAANLFYGERLGDLMYGFLQELCEKAFNNKVSAEVPIVMTTAQSAYNRFSGWYNSESHTIELVNHLCKSSEGGIVAKDNKEILLTLAHEFCHLYQFKILGGTKSKRGPHRCKNWYESITLASPFVCGVNINGLCKPLKSVRENGKIRKISNEESLTESELTHWPRSIIELLRQGDERLKERAVEGLCELLI
jgi:hypothetical protein